MSAKYFSFIKRQLFEGCGFFAFLNDEFAVHLRVQFFSRTLSGAVKGELTGMVGPKLSDFGYAHHGAVQEDRFVVTADGQSVPDTQSVIGGLEGDLNHLALFDTNDWRIVSPGAFGHLDAYVRLAQLLACE